MCNVVADLKKLVVLVDAGQLEIELTVSSTMRAHITTISEGTSTNLARKGLNINGLTLVFRCILDLQGQVDLNGLGPNVELDDWLIRVKDKCKPELSYLFTIMGANMPLQQPLASESFMTDRTFARQVMFSQMSFQCRQ